MGTAFFMFESLKNYQVSLEKVYLKPASSLILAFFNKLINKIFGLKYNLSHSIYASFFHRKQLGKILDKCDYDLIIAPAMSNVVSRLQKDVPVIYISDVTVKLMYNYYEWFSGFTFFSYAESNAIEKKALQRADRVIFSSDWAAKSAINDYHTDPEKISIIPFGANMQPGEVLPKGSVINREKGRKCNLLFIGMEWERKGGNIVLEAMEYFRSAGFTCELTILGCDPEEAKGKHDIRIIPYIDKKTDEGKAQWNKLMLAQHFLILPTRAECFGVVFCEASAYGIPSMATDTGGIPNAVINGQNGYRFPLEARGDEYAKMVMEIYSDYEKKYLPLSRSSRKTFDELLNWDHWAKKTNEVIEKLLDY